MGEPGAADGVELQCLDSRNRLIRIDRVAENVLARHHVIDRVPGIDWMADRAVRAAADWNAAVDDETKRRRAVLRREEFLVLHGDAGADRVQAIKSLPIDLVHVRQ